MTRATPSLARNLALLLATGACSTALAQSPALAQGPADPALAAKPASPGANLQGDTP